MVVDDSIVVTSATGAYTDDRGPRLVAKKVQFQSALRQATSPPR
jgi:hypothetical protein